MSALRLAGHEQRAFFYCLIIFCLAYAYELTHFNVSIDDEFLAFGKVCHFAGIGRWLHPVIKQALWPQMVAPAGPMLVFGAAISLAYVFVLRMFSFSRPSAGHGAVFAAFVLFPTWMAQLEFSANIIPVAVGVVCAVLAAWVLLGPLAVRGVGWPLWARVAAAALLVAVAAGAYQSLILLVLVLALGASLRAVARAQTPARTFWHMLGAGVAALVLGSALSLGAAKLVMLACGVGVEAYAQSHFDPGAFLRDPQGMLRMVFKYAGRQVWGYWKPFGVAHLVFTGAVLLCAAVCLHAALPGRRWLVLGGLCIIFMLPTGFILVTGGVLPVRTYFATAGVLCSFLLLAYGMAQRPWVRGLVAGVALLVAVQGLYIHSIQQARGWMVRQHDARLAQGIYNELIRQSGANSETAVWVDIRGRQAFKSIYPAVEGTTHGASFFDWDEGSVYRMIYYFHLMGYPNLLRFPESFPGEFDAAYASMPAWPAQGSVKAFGKGYLVKLSP